jgi:polyether ionophore transport system permease protein
MKSLVGTGQLVRLVLRRDRLRLAIWVAVLILVPVGTASAFVGLYPLEAEREQLVRTVASNPAIVSFLGPVYASNVGALTAWRVGTIGSLLVGLMAILTVIRNTRAEEETGRRELLGSTVIGRHAALTAALLVAGGAGLVIGLGVAVGLVGVGLPATGAVMFGAGFALIAVVFSATAGVAAQLTEGAGAARGVAVGIAGLAFLLRVAGDGGEASGIGWLSWLSPIGWFTRLRPFASERWSVIALFFGLALLLGIGAYTLTARRDVAAGVIAPRPGPAAAASWLRSPFGLAWRIHRPSLFGWLAGLVIVGLVYGSLADSIGDLLDDSPQLSEIFEQLGGAAGLTDAFFATTMGILALIATAYAIRAVLRLRVEEEGLRAEPILATATPRLRWVRSHLVYAIAGPVLMLALAGAASGATYGTIVDDLSGAVPRVVEAALIQVPAVWVVVGVAVALFGLLPRATAVSWGVLVSCLLLGQLGQILQFPQWALNLSPFSHIPRFPAADFELAPLLILTALAIILTAIGMLGFQRRDVLG